MSQWEYTLVRSDRKTLGLQVRPDGTVLVRAPLHLPKGEIDRFIREKSPWIEKHLALVEQDNRAGEEAPLSMQEVHALAQKAVAELPPRVRAYAARMGVTYSRITIRNQQGRWGSCSSTGSLNFNCLLMLAPAEVQDYVIVHELAHRKEMNHSDAFWAQVEAVLPDYRERRKWLNSQGKILLARMRWGTKEG